MALEEKVILREMREPETCGKIGK